MFPLHLHGKTAPRSGGQFELGVLYYTQSPFNHESKEKGHQEDLRKWTSLRSSYDPWKYVSENVPLKVNLNYYTNFEKY